MAGLATMLNPDVSSFPETEFCCTTRLPTEEIADRLEVMRIQEETTYQCSDYLQRVAHLAKKKSIRNQTQINPVDEECRVKMCDWCYQVADFCKFKRETVGIGMSYLDRYLSTGTPRGTVDRKEYQLAAMTTLYMAIKLFEPMEMETSLLAELSRGCYTEAEIAAMEKDILNALQWRVHGPTPLTFVQYFLELLPSSVAANRLVYDTILDFSTFQTEIAIGEYFFVPQKQSSIAVAAVLNAMEGVSTKLFTMQQRMDFLRSVADAAKVDLLSNDIRLAKQHLSQCFVKSAGTEMKNIVSQVSYTTPEDTASASQCRGYISPICVSKKGSALETR